MNEQVTAEVFVALTIVISVAFWLYSYFSGRWKS